MKILFVAPQDTTALGEISTRSLAVLRRMGHEVVAYDFRRRPYARASWLGPVRRFARFLLPRVSSPYDVKGIRAASDALVNRELIDLARGFKPDLALVYCGENIDPATVDVWREGGAVTANWFHDSLLYASRQGLIRTQLAAYDHVFLVDSGDVFDFIGSGVSFRRAHTLPLGCDPELHRRLDLSGGDRRSYGCDVAFVGTLSAERVRVLEALAGFDLKIWGRWERTPPSLRRFCVAQGVFGEEVVKIYNAAKIVVDIHVLWGSAPRIFNVTPRFFDVPACGGFLLGNDIPQAHQFYRAGREMVFYRDTDSLKGLVHYYLSHEKERSEMADRAYARARREHTLEGRLRRLLEIAGEAG